MTGINLLNIFVNFSDKILPHVPAWRRNWSWFRCVSRLFFVFARARRAVSLAKSYAFSFARVWRAVFFGAKVLLWADGKKRLRLMSLWCQRQLSAKFLRFLKKLSLLDRVQNFDIPQPFSAEINRKKRCIAVHLPFPAAVKRRRM